jgi:peptidoglycan pentaglycine glycine transferase (the first glycine)
MNFEIFRENAEIWDTWLLEHNCEEFLQSYNWGEFQSHEGKEVLRICGLENGKKTLQIQGFVHTLPLGMKYLYIPHNIQLGKNTEEFLNFVKAQDFLFARFEPIDEIVETKLKKVKTHHRQYQYTSVINLMQSDDELLKSFHEKTRYNIRLATKKGVVIKQEKNIDIFWPLLQETYIRDGIKSHSEKYYRDFIALRECTQLTAYFEDIPVASVLLYMFGRTCVYVHGASGNVYRNVMAPYLIQWESLQYARDKSCAYYDLGGVAKPLKLDDLNAETFFTYSWDKNDKLSGVTRFKAGFDGTIKHYADAYDVVFRSTKYFLYQIARKFL